MMLECGTKGESRSSALWGKRTGGDGSRSSALWGKGGRTLLLLALAFVALAFPATGRGEDTFVPEGLLETAAANPDEELRVIVVGDPGTDSGEIKNEKMKDADGDQSGDVQQEFKHVIDGVVADLTGDELVALAQVEGIRSITPDVAVLLEGGRVHCERKVSKHQKPRHVPCFKRKKKDDDEAPVEVPQPVPAFSPLELWPLAVGADGLWGLRDALSLRLLAPPAPAIAIVDSGVDRDRVADFGGRVVQSLNLGSGGRDDEYGHGTLVAGFAAGAATSYPGVAPSAPIISLRVLDSKGMAYTSDVIAAADWIYENRAEYGIRVANFSLHSASSDWAMHDPLNLAVRRLWLAGTVVVAPAGNNGPERILHAPASDPFVITVGAVDIMGTAAIADDTNAPWTSYGYTAEGFAKPELAAPGRMMVGPVPAHSTLTATFPERVVAPGYMWMSGTSFAAPVVAGAAAQILARHPGWTPDQVKGALMLTARPLPSAAPMSVGVGEIDAAAAAGVSEPPNANGALWPFVVPHADTGDPVFDAASWASVAGSDASWANASWASASWASASWSSASWSNASWSNASWANASWANASWANASWANASWASSHRSDGDGDDDDEGGARTEKAEFVELPDSGITQTVTAPGGGGLPVSP